MAKKQKVRAKVRLSKKLRVEFRRLHTNISNQITNPQTVYNMGEYVRLKTLIYNNPPYYDSVKDAKVRLGNLSAFASMYL